MKTIPISRGLEVMVDDADYDLVMQNRWTAYTSPNDKTFYAMRHIKRGGKWKHISLHRFLMGEPRGMKVDHWDGNGLNNQRANLRLCTHAQNLMNMRCHNKHGYKGVARLKCVPPSRQWISKIHIDGKLKTIGYFPNLIDAAIAYNVAAARHFGEFSKLNPLPFTF